MRASGHDNAVAGAYLVGCPVYHEPPLAIFDAKELIRVGVYIATDFFSRLKRHKTQL
jgi:hypothetical protein